MRFRWGAWAALSVALFSLPLGAQEGQPPHLVGDGTLLVANTLIGGTSALIYRIARHQSGAPDLGRLLAVGAARGAAGGVGVYAGKRLIANGQPAYWWIGRMLSSAGSSEISNAGLELAPLEQVVLPVGPFRLHVDRMAKRKVAPALDVVSSVAAVVLGSRKGNRFALRESLASDALVFVTPEKSGEIGSGTLGVLSISELLADGKFPPFQSKRSVMSHELIHVVQSDFTFNAFATPLQGFIVQKVSPLAPVLRYFDVNLVFPIDLFGNSLMEYSRRPWEIEAWSLARHAP